MSTVSPTPLHLDVYDLRDDCALCASIFLLSAYCNKQLTRLLVVAGASGGIGQVCANCSLKMLILRKLTFADLQPLSLLLKTSPHIDELALYDVVNTPGVATDLSHISSRAVSRPQLSPGQAFAVPFHRNHYLLTPFTEDHWLPSCQRWR